MHAAFIFGAMLALGGSIVAQSQAVVDADPFNPRTRPIGDVVGSSTSSRWDPLPSHFGPFLRFSGREGDIATYSVLIGVASTETEALLGLSIILAPKANASKPVVLRSFGTYSFIRWILTVKMADGPITLRYQIKAAATGLFSAKTGALRVPSKTEAWNYGYNSCNGFHDLKAAPATGIEPMWTDVVDQHRTKPFHLMISDGDQLYNDAVLEDIPELAALKQASNASSVLAFNWTQAVTDKTHYWLMSHYIYHWSVISESYTKALASIPFAMSWDDHELFNGFGSWPDFLQKSNFFTGFKEIARSWYLLFQHHSQSSAPELMMADLRWNVENGLGGYHWFSVLDPYTAVILPDLRSERTQLQVLSPASQAAILARIQAKAPSTIKHLVMASSSPVIYAFDVAVTNYVFAKFSLKPFGLENTIYNLWQASLSPSGAPLVAAFAPVFGKSFGMLDLSDVIDNWESHTHLQERADTVHALQDWAAGRMARVSFLGGDSHLGYAGKIFTPGYAGPIERDPRWSLSITSSAIGNNPATGLVDGFEAAAPAFRQYLDASNKTLVMQIPAYALTPELPERANPLFFFVPLRNYVRGRFDARTQGMVFQQRFETYSPSESGAPLRPAQVEFIAPQFLGGMRSSSNSTKMV